jgi:ketosteroid isomerase-like protein
VHRLARLLPATATIALTAIALGGCGGVGGNSESDKVREAVNQFVQAGNDRDFNKVCALLTLQQRLASGGQDCAKNFGAHAPAGKGSTEVVIKDVRISGAQAAVDATVKGPHAQGSLQQLLLQKQNGEWKVATAE